MNDLVLDAKGIYFSDPRYLGTEPRELEHRAVYRIDTDGTVVEVTHEVEKPNGIALSPDGKTLYLADHNNGTDRIVSPPDPGTKAGAMRIYAFPLGPDGLVSGDRKIVVDFKDQAGCDGMTVDSKGHVYLSVRNLKRAPCIAGDRSHRQGSRLYPHRACWQSGSRQAGSRHFEGNVTFGIGPEKNVLYITIDLELYRIPLKAEGYVPEGEIGAVMSNYPTRDHQHEPQCLRPL